MMWAVMKSEQQVQQGKEDMIDKSDGLVCEWGC